jgi:putative addiction module component (TIGR02574 family)
VRLDETGQLTPASKREIARRIKAIREGRANTIPLEHAIERIRRAARGGR